MFKNIIFANCFLFLSIAGFETSVVWNEPQTEASIIFTIPVDSNDALYKEYMDFSANHDAVSIAQWNTNEDAVSIYDPVFKETKKVYTHNTTFKVDIHIKEPIEDVTIRVTYYRKSKGCFEEQLLHIPISPREATSTSNIPEKQQEPIHEQNNPAQELQQPKSIASWSCAVSHIIQRTQSLWIQMLLILLLGALLSLTPCIYPMIPITVGILQGQGSRSFLRNLFLSCCYTIGIAMTFATLGLTAAYTGKLFGSFMQHPLVICLVVMVLLYLSGSMLGLYEMYIPKLFNTSNHYAQGGSPLAAFLFGMISGTVASPCVSPGLALVLSIVTGLANPLLGFLFLFAFGIGLSLPLLIIGTCSSSLNLLPRAGSWMVEIKKIFGFLLLGMSLYFLSIMLPPFIHTWLLAILLFATGMYYLYTNTQRNTLGRIIYNVIGIILIASSIIVSYFAIRATADPHDCSIVGLWTTDYMCAREQARYENRLLLLKVEAPCCSLCTAINKKFFSQNSVTAVLDTSYIPVRIDGSRSTDPMIQKLIKQFGIIGFPTIIVADPQKEHIIKKWESELYNYSVEQFIEELTLLRSERSE